MNSQTTNNTPDPCIFIFDSTRLRSHLFFRYLTTSPQVAPILHPFIAAATFGREQKFRHMQHSTQRQKELDEKFAPLMGPDTFQSCSETFSSAVLAAQADGKVPVANEHWFNVCKTDIVLSLVRGEIHTPDQLCRNPTHMPDQIFDSLQPVILIRHPALSIRSMYRDAVKMTALRPGDEDFDLICMNKPLRLMFDYFRAQGRQPVVVDAEDILLRTEAMSKSLCASLGTIDAGSLRDRWEPASQKEMQALHPVMVMLMKNILESSGIERPGEKPPEPSIERMYQEWKEQCDEADAKYLRRLAEDNMPHYEYLSQFKA